jgi:hypothetical protein
VHVLVKIKLLLKDKMHGEYNVKRDTNLPLLFNFTLECAIGKIQANQEGLKLNGNHHLVYSDDVNFLSEKRNTEALFATSKEIDLEVNATKTKYSIHLCLANIMQDKITTER